MPLCESSRLSPLNSTTADNYTCIWAHAMQVEPVINARTIANPPLAVPLIPRADGLVNGLMTASSMPSLFQRS